MLMKWKRPYRRQIANQFVENIVVIVEAGLNGTKLNQLNYGLVVQCDKVKSLLVSFG